jgi:hypothetical protein
MPLDQMNPNHVTNLDRHCSTFNQEKLCSPRITPGENLKTKTI